MVSSLQAFVFAAALAGSGDLVLLDFSADWCVPCRGMEPTIRRLQEEGFPVRRVDVERSPEVARHFSVSPIPCFVMVKDGREVDRLVGSTSFDRLVQMFRQAGYGPTPSGESGVRGQSPDPVPLSSLPPPRSSIDRSPLQPVHLPSDRRHPLSSQPLPRAPETRDLAGSQAGREARAPANNASNRSAADPIHQLALQATVRLLVVDPSGQSHGTGTIIDSHGDEALVLTCGHIFRDSRGQGEIHVELFAPGTRGPLQGHLLAYESERRDFGLVSIRPDVPVTPVRVASTDYHARQGEPVFSIGCDHGADPTVRVSTISAVDRYSGPPNLEIYGHPVQGRSGGGLFTADGRIIGICNAADLQEDRGIFAALPTVHYALTSINQQRIYLDPRPSPNAAPTTPRSDGLHRIADTGGVSLVPASTVRPGATDATGDRVACSEVIVIVRSHHDPNGGRVIVVKNPTPALLQQLSAEAQPEPASSEVDGARLSQTDIARLPNSAVGRPPIVRAQGY